MKFRTKYITILLTIIIVLSSAERLCKSLKTNVWLRIGEFLIDSTSSGSTSDQPSTVFNGNDYLIVWQDSRSGPWDIYGARVDQAGNVLDPAGIPLSVENLFQQVPAIAFDGINYFVVWQDERDGYDMVDVYGARVDQIGNVLDTNGIPISTASMWQLKPDIAFDGTNYFVVWANSGGYIIGTRVDQNGTVLDPNGIIISDNANFKCIKMKSPCGKTEGYLTYQQFMSLPCRLVTGRVSLQWYEF